MHIPVYSFFLLLPLIVAAAGKILPVQVQNMEIRKRGNVFHKIDYSDTNYIEGLAWVTHDTVLPSGFRIEYLVKESTRYDDLYIRWSNGNFADTLHCPGRLWIRDLDYVPVFSRETPGHILLDYDCAAIECTGITILSKKKQEKPIYLSHVLYENIEENVFVYAYANSMIPTDLYYIFDLSTQKTTEYKFPGEIFLDSVSVQNGKVFLFGYDDWETMDKKREAIVSLERP